MLSLKYCSNLIVYYYLSPSLLSTAASTEVTTIPTSVLSQVMDQATLSTMQAEMIAVQVLSQSATGDIQYLQHQSPRFIPIVTTADPNTLNSLQATLSQMPLATLQVSEILIIFIDIYIYIYAHAHGA